MAFPVVSIFIPVALVVVIPPAKVAFCEASNVKAKVSTVKKFISEPKEIALISRLSLSLEFNCIFALVVPASVKYKLSSTATSPAKVAFCVPPIVNANAGVLPVYNSKISCCTNFCTT